MQAEGKGLVLVTGGVRCGKSRFAENLARTRGRGQVLYLATCQPGDVEMRERIRRHRQRRPVHWQTLEEPLYPARALQERETTDTTILLDCLALLLANHLGEEMQETAEVDSRAARRFRERVLGEVESLIAVSRDARAGMIVVSNEVGWGLVPPYPSGRVYRDLLGEANSLLAAAAREVFLLVAGLPLELKSLVWAGEGDYAQE